MATASGGVCSMDEAVKEAVEVQRKKIGGTDRLMRHDAVIEGPTCGSGDSHDEARLSAVSSASGRATPTSPGLADAGMSICHRHRTEPYRVGSVALHVSCYVQLPAIIISQWPQPNWY